MPKGELIALMRKRLVRGRAAVPQG